MSSEGQRVRDKISDKIARHVKDKKPFFSFEYFVPKTPEGILNLYGRIQRMGETKNKKQNKKKKQKESFFFPLFFSHWCVQASWVLCSST